MSSRTASPSSGDGWSLFDAAIAWAIDVNDAPTIDLSGIANPVVVGDPRDTVIIWPDIDDDDQPEPPILPVAWSQQSGPGVASFSPADNPRTDVSFPLPGAYQLKVTANDGLRTTEALIPVTVNPYEQRFPEFVGPIVVTPSATVQLPATVNLSITVTDADGSVKTYQWAKLSGPDDATVVFGTPNATATIATFPVKGTYTVGISVTDTVDQAGGGTAPVTQTYSTVIEVRAAALLVVSSSVSPPTDASISAGDLALKNRLQGLGFTTTLVKDSVSTSGSATGKQLVVISGSVSDANVTNKFRNVTVPVVVLRPTLFDDMRMTSTTNNTHYGTQTGQSQLSIVATTHPLAAGLSGNVNVSGEAGDGGQAYGWGVPAGTATLAASLVGVPTKATVFGYEQGAVMFSSTPAAHRRVGFFATDATVTELTREGWLLFDAATSWGSGNNMAPAVDVGPDLSLEPDGGGTAATTLQAFVKDDGVPAPLAAGGLTWSCLGINCANVIFGTPQPPPGEPLDERDVPRALDLHPSAHRQ